MLRILTVFLTTVTIGSGTVIAGGRGDHLWTIEAKVLPIAGPLGNHLYIEIWRPDGTRFDQINGYATFRSDGSCAPVGTIDEQIMGHFDKDLSVTASATQATSPHDGLVLFRGSLAQVMDAYAYAQVVVDYLNNQNFSYNLLATAGFNSNSVFNTVALAMQRAVPIPDALIEDARGLNTFVLNNPGADDDMFQGNGWELISGTEAGPTLVLEHTGFRPWLISGSGGDRLFGLAGDDLLIGRAGADLLDGGPGFDTADYSDLWERPPGTEATLGLAPLQEHVRVLFGASEKTDDLLVVDRYGDTDQLNSIEKIVGQSGAANEIEVKGSESFRQVDRFSPFRYEFRGTEYELAHFSRLEGDDAAQLLYLHPPFGTDRAIVGNGGDDWVTYRSRGGVYDAAAQIYWDDLGRHRDTFSGIETIRFDVDSTILPDVHTSGNVNFEDFILSHDTVDYTGSDRPLFFDFGDGRNNRVVIGDVVHTIFGFVRGSHHGDTYDMHWSGLFSAYTGKGDDIVTMPPATPIQGATLHYTGGHDIYRLTELAWEIRLAPSIVLDDITVSLLNVENHAIKALLTIDGHGSLLFDYDDRNDHIIPIILESGGQITLLPDFLADGGSNVVISGSSTVASTLSGTWGADTWVGRPGTSQSYYGKGGDDLMTGGDGDDRIYGGPGNDIAVFNGPFANYSLAQVGEMLQVEDRVGNDGTDLVDAMVERLQFADGRFSNGTFVANASNRDPVARDDRFVHDGVKTIVGNLLRDNGSGPDSDPDGDPISVRPKSYDSFMGGSLRVWRSGYFSYTPNEHGGDEQFVYHVSDHLGNSAVGRVAFLRQ